MPEIKLRHRFDSTTNRHYLNDKQMVLHCHHYAVMYTQLAIDAQELGGIDGMVNVAAKVFGGFLSDYYKANGVESQEDKISLAESYWKALGMGLVKITANGAASATAEMEYSHMDEGWLKKWGAASQPVNLFTQGFLKGTLGAIYNVSPDSYSVEETRSLVQGDAVSAFTVTAK